MKKLFFTIALAFLVLPAQARPQAVVGKPKIITRTIWIKTGLMPPPKYDKPYEGDLEIQFFTNSEDIAVVCKDSHSEAACAAYANDLKTCRIHILTEDALKRKGFAYNFALRHELAHCNGWKHPATTGGRHFDVGEAWDAAEGAKWLAANTKVAAPKLPASTRILPASPPVVCVTPHWQPESCENRKTVAAPATAKAPVPTWAEFPVLTWPETGTYEEKWRWCRQNHYAPLKCKEM